MGVGAAALYNLMEDAATAEISRTQLWLWLHKQVILENGNQCTKSFYELLIKDELLKIKEYVGENRFQSGKFELATQLFSTMIFNEKLDEFLTLEAYEYL